MGAFAGNRLGAVRDAKGKSVAAVFNQLGGQQKAEVSQMHNSDKFIIWLFFGQILRALALKVLGSAL